MGRLCDQLRGAGVPNLDQELTRLRLRPLHDTLRQAIAADRIQALATIACEREPACRVRPRRDPKHPTRRSPLDPRLQSLVEKSQIFYDKLLENLPHEEPRADGHIPRSPAAKADRQPTLRSPSKAPSYADTVRATAAAATLIPSLAQCLHHRLDRRSAPPAPGPQAGHAGRPRLGPAARVDCSPQPSLAGRHGRLSSTASNCAPRSPTSSPPWAWRAKPSGAPPHRSACCSPRPAATPVSVRTETFWADPDVRWLAGVNTASGITYFNREQFEELLAWLQLPALIRIAQRASGQAKAIAELESAFAAACEAAHAAGYQLDALPGPSNLNLTQNRPDTEARRELSSK